MPRKNINNLRNRPWIIAYLNDYIIFNKVLSSFKNMGFQNSVSRKIDIPVPGSGLPNLRIISWVRCLLKKKIKFSSILKKVERD